MQKERRVSFQLNGMQNIRIWSTVKKKMLRFVLLAVCFLMVILNYKLVIEQNAQLFFSHKIQEVKIVRLLGPLLVYLHGTR